MRRPGATLAPIAALCAEQEFFIELEYINYSFKTRLISLPSISGFGYLYCSLRFIESIGHFLCRGQCKFTRFCRDYLQNEGEREETVNNIPYNEFTNSSIR